MFAQTHPNGQRQMMESWRWRDPFEVYAQVEAQEQYQTQKALRKAGKYMDQDTSEQIEELLQIWYDWETGYRPALGAPSVSCYAKSHRASDGSSDPDAADEKLNRIKAEAVDACIDQLPWQQRSAIGMHFHNKRAKHQIFRNPRLTLEQQHMFYQAAKADLLPGLRRKELI